MVFRASLIRLRFAAATCLVVIIAAAALCAAKDCSNDDPAVCGRLSTEPLGDRNDGEAGTPQMRKRFLPKYLLKLSSSGAADNRRHPLLPRLSNQLFGVAAANAAARDAPERSDADAKDIDGVWQKSMAPRFPEDESPASSVQIGTAKTNELHQLLEGEEEANNIDPDRSDMNRTTDAHHHHQQEQQRQQQIRDVSSASVRQQHRRDINAWMIGSSGGVGGGGGDAAFAADTTRFLSAAGVDRHHQPSSPAAHQLMLLGSVGRFDAAALEGGRRRNSVRLEKFISRPCYFSPVQCLLHIPDKKLANFFEVIARPLRDAEPLVAVDFEEPRLHSSVDVADERYENVATTVDARNDDHHVDDLFATASAEHNGVVDSHQRQKLLVFQVPANHQPQSSSVGGAGSGALAVEEAAASASAERHGKGENDGGADASLSWRRRKSLLQRKQQQHSSVERLHQRHFVVPIRGSAVSFAAHLDGDGGEPPVPAPAPPPPPSSTSQRSLEDDGVNVSPPPPPITNSWTRFGSSRWRLLTPRV